MRTTSSAPWPYASSFSTAISCTCCGRSRRMSCKLRRSRPRSISTHAGRSGKVVEPKSIKPTEVFNHETSGQAKRKFLFFRAEARLCPKNQPRLQRRCALHFARLLRLTLFSAARKTGWVSSVANSFYAQWRLQSGTVPLLHENRDIPPELLL